MKPAPGTYTTQKILYAHWALFCRRKLCRNLQTNNYIFMLLYKQPLNRKKRNNNIIMHNDYRHCGDFPDGLSEMKQTRHDSI